jgi:Fe-Mn family superoxide dismutase
MDIRSTIDLIETKSKPDLERVKVDYKHGDLSPVMSSATFDLHYGKLYKAYVDRYNSGEGDKSFNEAGAFLHSIWFKQFRRPKASNKPTGTVDSIITRKYGSFEAFKKEFKEAAMKLQGSNWIYLSKSGAIKTISNHAKRTDIALLVDWWEHSWIHDYGTDKAKYLDNLWRIIDWNVINHRLSGTE